MGTTVRQWDDSGYGQASPQTFSISITPDPSDIIIISGRRTVGTTVPPAIAGLPSGLGATWELLYDHPLAYATFWIGRNPSSIGTITLPSNRGTTDYRYVAFLVGGVTGSEATNIDFVEQVASTYLAGPIDTAENGQFVLANGNASGTATIQGLLPSPSDWTVVSPATTGGLDWLYATPGGGAAAYQIEASGTIAATQRHFQILVGIPAPGPVENLIQSEATETSATVTWDSPSAGAAFDSYEVRVNQGTPVDVGLLQTYTVSDLTSGSSHVVEVRTMNAAGGSSWTAVTVSPYTPPPPPPPNTISWSRANTERVFETGLDRGVLYPKNAPAVPWNGLTAVDENSGEGAASYYIDGRPFLFLPKPKEFTATLKAYTYPDEFSAIMGVTEATDGMYLDSQMGDAFDLSYRTLIGDMVNGTESGYKIHLIYNATVTPSTVSYASLSNDINPVEFAWDIQAVPVPVAGYRPTAHIIIDTRHMDAARLADIEGLLYGDTVNDASMPDPQVIFDTLSFGDAIIITDNGDGTWTAEGSYHNIYMIGDGIFQIDNVDATDNGDGTYYISTTTPA